MNETKTSNARKKASRKYDDKAYSRITWRVPKGYNLTLAKRIEPLSLNEFITAAVNEKLNGGTAASIPDLAAYAKSAGLDPEEYILEAVKEKMKKQDETFTESIKRVKID